MTAYLGVIFGSLLGTVSYATNFFGLLASEEVCYDKSQSSDDDVFEKFMVFQANNEQQEAKWFNILLWHATFCAFILSLLFLFELYDDKTDLTLRCTIVASFAGYSLVSIILSFVKPRMARDKFKEMKKFMVSETDVAFFNFCLSPASNSTSNFFLLVTGLLYSFNSYFSSNALSDSLFMAVVFAWLLVCLIFVDK